jgi:hypothetical protein
MRGNMSLQTKIENNKNQLIKENITETYIDDRYFCGTCGNIGKCHPITGMCFICGDDNWKTVEGKENEIGY